MIPMDKENIIRSMAQSLRLPVFESYDKYLKPDMSIEDSLACLLSMEHERRNDARTKRRIKDAGLPNGKTIDTFKLVPSIPHLKEEHVELLSSCQFIKNNMNVCALGGNGTGYVKTVVM
jgi:DNA replication protein DnaC